MGKKKAPKKLIVPIVTTVIAIVSLGLNVLQFKSSEEQKSSEIIKEYPTVTSFYIDISSEGINEIENLVKKGTEFRHIPNPVFYHSQEFAYPSKQFYRYRFYALVNRGTIPLKNISIIDSTSSNPIIINLLEPNSTLLVPLSQTMEVLGISEPLQEIKGLTYAFQVRGNVVNKSVEIVPPSKYPVDIFEIGLGSATLLSNPDLDTETVCL